MFNYLRKFYLIVAIGLLLLLVTEVQPVRAQDPTPVIPTVTSTSTGPVIRVIPSGQDQINVRSGPGYSYPLIGVLILGQEMPAKGKTSGGDWIMVEYPGVPDGIGWVYSAYVGIFGGDVPIVEPPPTPTPKYTPTIDPTLASMFAYTLEPTRLPTFTPGQPFSIPTYEDMSTAPIVETDVPMGLIIFVLGAVGILLGIITLTQRR